jgi:hypothetical protein
MFPNSCYSIILTLGDCTPDVFSQHDGGGDTPIGYYIKFVMYPTFLLGLGPLTQAGDGLPLRPHPNRALLLEKI